MLLLFVNFNMMSFFRTHTWTLVYPGVSIPYNNLNLSQGCLKFNCLRSTFFHDMGVYNSIGTIHTGLNTRRALREMLTSGWLHFGPRRGCAACRRWALGLCWWNSTTVLNHNRGVYNSFWIKHTGLNTRRAFGKCSLRDDFTLEWLHFGPYGNVHFGMTTLRAPARLRRLSQVGFDSKLDWSWYCITIGRT